MAISIKQLKFHYPESPHPPVMSIENWYLGNKEKVFIHGPSGCGKTTFLNLISGIQPILTGSVKVLGHSIQNMKSRERDRFRANHIGCVFQSFNLVPYLSPIENLMLASQFSNKSPHHDTMMKLLDSLRLEANTWQKPTQHLSMGQKQRVAIARALINQPKLIIADEPTSSLDEKNRDAFITMLMEQVSQLDCALVFVSHDLSLARHFSRIESFKDINPIALPS